MSYQDYADSNASAGKSTHDIRRDLGQIRGEIDQTLDALSAQLQPGQLLHQAWQSLRGGGGGKMLNNLSRSVQENPLPLAMIAAGFGYLVYSDSRRRQEPAAVAPLPQQDDFDFEPIGIYSDGEAEALDNAFSQGDQSLKEAAKEKLQGVAEGAKEAKQQAKQKLSRGLDSSRERLEQSRRWAGDQIGRAEDGAQAVKTWGSNLIQEQPLVLAGLGIAVGATLAALVPVSRKEHEVLGSAGDSLRSKAGAAAQTAAEKAKELAEKVQSAGGAALEAGKQELGHQGVELASHSVEAPGASERPGATYAPNDPVSPGIRPAAAPIASGVGASEAVHRQTSVTMSYPSGAAGSGDPQR